MTSVPAKIIAYPGHTESTSKSKPSLNPPGIGISAPAQKEAITLEEIAGNSDLQAQIELRLKSMISELGLLKAENRWQEIIDLFHPLEDKEPEIVKFCLGLDLRGEIAFCLSQIKRFDDAIRQYEICLSQAPESFRLHSALGFTFYSCLLAAKNREILLPSQEKKARIRKAHDHFSRAEALKPDGVTTFYRHGMLCKGIEDDYNSAVTLLQKAVENWRKYSPETKKERHQEHKNYVKALYALASCSIKMDHPSRALTLLEACIEEDKGKDFIKPHHKGFAMGKVLFHLGRNIEAVRILEEAASLSKDDDNDFILELSARASLALKDPKRAFAAIERIPPNKRRHYVRWTEADCLFALGRKDQARAVLRRSADKDRRSKHRSLIRLAKMAFLEGNFTEAASCASESVEFHRETYSTPDADGLFWHAASCLRLGDVGTAKELTDELAAFRPGFPHIQRLKKEIEKKHQGLT